MYMNCIIRKSIKYSFIVCTFFLLVFVTSKMAFADDTVIDSGSCGNNLSWVITGTDTDMVLTISGTGEMANYSENTIPWASKRSKIKKLIVGEGVTTIGNYAFFSVNKLETIVMPSTITSIGEYSFAKDSNILTASIPSSVNYIGKCAFQDCVKLSSIIIPEGVHRINQFTFSGCSSMASIDIPPSVEQIDYGALKMALVVLVIMRSINAIVLLV